MPDTNSRVQAVIDEFVEKLSRIAREEAANILLKGINGRSSTSTRARNGSRGGKRSSESLEALQTNLLGFIRSHPGYRVEQINAELGTSTKDLALPMKKLIASKDIRTEGERRGMTYFVGGGGSKRSKSKRSKAIR